MNIRHIKLETTASTQLYLKQILSEDSNLILKSPYQLVSTIKQTDGVGRRGNSWMMLNNALAFSFTIKIPINISLYSLFLGNCLVDFFKDVPNLGLKWPNDLYLKNEKVGGIICHLLDNGTVLAGVGINLGEDAEGVKNSSFRNKANSIYKEKNLSLDDFHNIPLQIYKFILSQNPTDLSVVKKWNECCVHLFKRVQINEDNKIIEGEFKGIDSSGLAIITTDGREQKFMNGQLSILE